MRRTLLAALLATALAAPAATAQERRFPPRKPLPLPQRVVGTGPVLASAPSARYLAYRYGYLPVRPLAPPVVVPVAPPYHRFGAAYVVRRTVPVRVIAPVRPYPGRPAPLVVAPGVRTPRVVIGGGGGVLVIRSTHAPPVRYTFPPGRR